MALGLALGLAACAGQPAGPAAQSIPATSAPPTLAAGDFGPPGPAAPAAASPQAALADLAAACRAVDRHPILGTAGLDEVVGRLAAYQGVDPASLEARPKATVAGLHWRLSQELLKRGQFDRVLPEMDLAIRLMTEARVLPEPRLQALLDRATAKLRLAETENCFEQYSPFLCLIPAGPPGAYRKQDSVRSAIEDLTAVLETNQNQVEARWLLNVAHMLVGSFPDGVPPAWRVLPERIRSAAPAPRFRNVAADLGVAPVSLLGGAVMEDLDGDGNLDLFLTSYDPCANVSLYRSRGDGRFDDVTAAAGLAGITGGFNTVQTDYNGDGRVDLFITRGGWQREAGRTRPSLLRNNGDGSFDDVAREAGFAAAVYPTQVSAWADFDLDGDLDVFLGNETDDQDRPYPSQLFRNNGDGSFTDIAPEAGVTNDLQVKGATWGDYDNDGDEDLYVSNIGPNRLYRNAGDGTFTDVAGELGVTAPAGRSFATWFFDYDNDGWLDLFVAAYDALVSDVAAWYFGLPSAASPPRLYHNTGGRFEDATMLAGLGRPLQPMGANFGDIDNDGWPDFYLGTGDPDFVTLEPNVLFRNDGAGHFVDVTEAAGVGHLPKGHGISFGDLDNDGDQDIYLDAGGFYRGDASPGALFLNPGSGNHWLTVRLIGETSNRLGFGARLKAVIEEAGREREVHALVGTGGSFGANSVQQELGLGAGTRVKRLEVDWPGEGPAQVFADLPVDRFIELREGATTFTELARPGLVLPNGTAP